MNFSLPKIEFPSLPLPTSLPEISNTFKEQLDAEYSNKVNEASATVNADLQQTLNTAVENAKTGLVAAGEEITKNFYEQALALLIIFVACLAGLLLLAFIVKLIRDAIHHQKDSSDTPPQTV